MNASSTLPVVLSRSEPPRHEVSNVLQPFCPSSLPTPALPQHPPVTVPRGSGRFPSRPSFAPQSSHTVLSVAPQAGTTQTIPPMGCPPAFSAQPASQAHMHRLANPPQGRHGGHAVSGVPPTGSVAPVAPAPGFGVNLSASALPTFTSEPCAEESARAAADSSHASGGGLFDGHDDHSGLPAALVEGLFHGEWGEPSHRSMVDLDDLLWFIEGAGNSGDRDSPLPNEAAHQAFTSTPASSSSATSSSSTVPLSAPALVNSPCVSPEKPKMALLVVPVEA
eukprot:RCo037329